MIILFIASGMLARGVQFLVQVGYVPALVPRIRDSSWLVHGGSVRGRSLGALTGYTPSPSLMEVLVWTVSFVAIGGFMLAKSGWGRRRRPSIRSMTAPAAEEL